MEMPPCPECGCELQGKRIAENDLSNMVCTGCSQRFLFTLAECYVCVKCGRVSPKKVCNCSKT